MKYSVFCVVLTLAATASGFLSQSAQAQDGYRAYSIEWLAADAEIVVRATVAEVTRERQGETYATVSLNLLETLKGQAPVPLTFCYPSSDSGQYEAFKQADMELLWFLKTNPKYRANTGRTAEEPPQSRYRFKPISIGDTYSRYALPVSGGPQSGKLTFPIFRMNLDVLEDPNEILQVARAEARAASERPPARPHVMQLPQSVMRWSGKWADANEMTVPVDSRLESVARELIQSSAEVMERRGNGSPKRLQQELAQQRLNAAVGETERQEVALALSTEESLARNELRMAGVKALVYFKSNENIALLKSLLSDDVVWKFRGGSNQAVYHVRRAAYETLIQWGVEAPKPVLEVPATNPSSRIWTQP